MAALAADAGGGTPGQPVSSYRKQAIVVLHGIGEQKPMDTVKSFARAVWSGDSEILAKVPHANEIWSKPDRRTGLLELRRLTTRPSAPSAAFPDGLRQDFYELYWADLSGGSTWDQVKNWVATMLLRNPFTNVPRKVMLAWLLLWLVSSTIVVLVVATVLPAPKLIVVWPPTYEPMLWNYPPFCWLAGVSSWLLGPVVAVLAWLVNFLIVPYVGRVVRYTSAIPDNIAARTAIRERGLALLNALHTDEYDRIIVVGHSLGSILAYDLVSHFWATQLPSHTVSEGTPEFDALRVLEELAKDLKEAGIDKAVRQQLLERWAQAQRRFAHLLRTRGYPDRRWLITDLVTVGSPLGNADFLVAKNPGDLEIRIAERELATCPPLREELDAKALEKARKAGLPVAGETPALFSFPMAHGQWQLHHAAQFAAVRWTNIHDPARLVLFGDIVSAPAAPIFGPGVIDVDLKEVRRRLVGIFAQSLWFTHLDYWMDGDPAPPALAELRAALDLAGQKNP